MPTRTRWRLRYPVTTEDDQNRLRHRLATFNADPHVEQVFCHIPPEDPFVRELRVIFRPGFTQPATPELQHMNLTQTGELQTTSEAQYIAEALRTGHGGMFQQRPDVFDFVYTEPRPPPPVDAPAERPTAWNRLLKGLFGDDEK